MRAMDITHHRPAPATLAWLDDAVIPIWVLWENPLLAKRIALFNLRRESFFRNPRLQFHIFVPDVEGASSQNWSPRVVLAWLWNRRRFGLPLSVWTSWSFWDRPALADGLWPRCLPCRGHGQARSSQHAAVQRAASVLGQQLVSSLASSRQHAAVSMTAGSMHACMQAVRQSDSQTDRQSDRQTVRQTVSQADSQTADRQTDRQTRTHPQTDRQTGQTDN